MLRALAGRAPRRMQREPEEDQPSHARERRRRLRLRGHAPAERLSAGEQRKLWYKTGGFSYGGADGGMREFGRVRPLAAALLHVEELVAQGRDATLGKLGRDRGH